jgi:hypothetical protein
MDPISAPATPPNPEEDRPSGLSLRQLWQVPVFFLGLVAVLMAFLTRGIVQPDPVRNMHQDLAEARRLLHRRSDHPQQALAHAQRAVENLMYDQARAAEAFFLLGSAHIRAAESAGESDAAAHWREAQQALQEAERRGLGGDDAGRLQYQLAKVAFYSGDDPAHVVALLKENKDQADDRAEALTLLMQAYLRLNPPDLKKALETNRLLRDTVPQIGEDVLGPAKLAGAKLLLRLGQPDEARKTLEKISDQAPPAVLSEAHMLLAGLYQEEQLWAEAAALWRAVLDDKRAKLNEPSGVLYNLGVCCRHLEQSKEAADAWSDCLQHAHGEEEQAAALSLAELRLQQAEPEKAVELLTRAVAKVRKAEDWKNSLLGLPRVRELFEQAIAKYREAGRLDLAVQVAELYERVAVPPAAQLRRAELSTEWARSAQKRAGSAKDAAARKKEETTTCELFRQAAEAHAEAARLVTKPEEKDEHLWQSSVCSLDGRDYARAAEKLPKIIKASEKNMDRQSEAWFLLGEACRNLNDPGAAQTAYRKCVECDARFIARARYQLALIDIEAGKIDEAIHELDQNLKDHRDRDPEAEEKSRFAYCSLLHQSASKLSLNNYRQVVQILESHLDRLPLTPESVRARFQLADSYRQLAAQSTVNHYMEVKMSTEAHDHYMELNRRYLRRAAEEFGKLEDMIKDEALAALLTHKQRLEVPFVVAQCRSDLGEYEKALQKYDELAKKWGNRPEALSALGGAVQCHGRMGDLEQLCQCAEQIRNMLPSTEGLSEADRQKWLEWLTQISKVPVPSPQRDAGREPAPAPNDRDGPVLNPDHQ